MKNVNICQISARLIQLVFLLKRQMPPFATAFTVLNPTGQSREWDKWGHMLHVLGGFKTSGYCSYFSCGFFLCSTSWGSSRADLVGFSWRSSCAPRSLAAFSPQKVQILVQGLRKGKMCCAAGFCNNCQSCMHAFFYCAAFFCCFVWIFSMDHPFTLRLEAWSFLGCEDAKRRGGVAENGGPLGKGDEPRLEPHQFLGGELLV